MGKKNNGKQVRSLSYTGVVEFGGLFRRNIYLNGKELVQAILEGMELPDREEQPCRIVAEMNLTIRRLDEPLEVSGNLLEVE